MQFVIVLINERDDDDQVYLSVSLIRLLDRPLWFSSKHLRLKGLNSVGQLQRVWGWMSAVRSGAETQ